MIGFSEKMKLVQDSCPLVHHITNYVTVNDCANICICAHGSPVMTDAIEDVSDMATIASSLVLNIGTLNERTVGSMLLAGSVAKDAGVPVVFDPVGIGATAYRTSVVERILDEVRPDIIKGNSGEIGILTGAGGDVRGVDSRSSSDGLADSMRSWASEHGCILVSTGVKDLVTDGRRVYELSNGSVMMETVSGTGCMLSSVVGVYAGAHGRDTEAMVTAVTMFNVSSEIAAEGAQGPGSFKMNLFDAVYGIDADTVMKKAKVRML